VQLAAIQPELEALGVATVAIVNSFLERARLPRKRPCGRDRRDWRSCTSLIPTE
jgi:hypothetical protein